MPNHFHLLAETPHGNLDRFMGSLLTGYTVYFNRRHQRVGHLMQGRYGAQVVEGNAYLLKLSRYIHLNPVQIQGARELPPGERVRRLREYPWSSFRQYAGKAERTDWISDGPVLAMMPAKDPLGRRKAYLRYVESGLAKTDDEFVQLMKSQGVAIGSENFVESVKTLQLRKAAATLKREDVSFRQIRNWKTAEDVKTAVRKIVGGRWEQFEEYKNGRVVRGFTAWALRNFAGLTQREVAKQVGVTTGAAVSMMIDRALADPDVQRWQKKLELRFKG